MKTMKRTILYVSVFCLFGVFSNTIFALGGKESGTAGIDNAANGNAVSTEEKDGWKRITDVNDLAGNWEGQGTMLIPSEDIPNLSASVDVKLAYVANAADVFMFTKINMSDALDEMVKFANEQNIGMAVTKDFVWEQIFNENEDMDKTNKYYTISNTTISRKAILLDDSLRINQDKTQIRMIFGDGMVVFDKKY